MADRFGLPGLQRARKSRRLTQRQLAQESGVSEGSIRHYERGERFPSEPADVQALAKALKVTVADLYVEQDEESEDGDRPRGPLRWQDLDPSKRWQDLGPGVTADDLRAETAS